MNKARDAIRTQQRTLRERVKSGSNLEQVDSRLQELEYRLTHETHSPVDEKRLTEQIRALQQAKPVAGELAMLQQKLDGTHTWGPLLASACFGCDSFDRGHAAVILIYFVQSIVHSFNVQYFCALKLCLLTLVVPAACRRERAPPPGHQRPPQRPRQLAECHQGQGRAVPGHAGGGQVQGRCRDDRHPQPSRREDRVPRHHHRLLVSAANGCCSVNRESAHCA